MGSLILLPACRGDRLFVVDFLFSYGFLDPLPGSWGVTDSLSLTFCFSIMVSLLPLLECSGDWICRAQFSTPTFGRLTRVTDSVAGRYPSVLFSPLQSADPLPDKVLVQRAAPIWWTQIDTPNTLLQTCSICASCLLKTFAIGVAWEAAFALQLAAFAMLFGGDAICTAMKTRHKHVAFRLGFFCLPNG